MPVEVKYALCELTQLGYSLHMTHCILNSPLFACLFATIYGAFPLFCYNKVFRCGISTLLVKHGAKFQCYFHKAIEGLHNLEMQMAMSLGQSWHWLGAWGCW